MRTSEPARESGPPRDDELHVSRSTPSSGALDSGRRPPGAPVLLNAERQPMRHPGDTVENPRDLRIDVLRGLAICFVVVNHIDIPSAYHVVSQEALAPITGAEMFVALSGVVLAMAYRRRAELGVRKETMVPLWRRARKLYLTAVAVAVLAWLTQFIPGVDARVLTTWAETDADGKLVRWDLYGGAAYGLPWPIPGHLLGDLLFLRVGPSQFNVIGLYVVLLAAAPLVLALLKRDRWKLVLAASVAVYGVYRLSPQHVLPSTFESPFPLMAWQLLFVLGMLAGWYRAALLRFAGTVWGRVCLAACVVLFLGAFFLTSNNPWKPFVAGSPAFTLSVIPEETFGTLYISMFERTDLDPGRVLVVVVTLVTLYAALTAFWRPLSRTLVPVLAPLGQATLYVFVLQVFAVLLVANIQVPSTTPVIWGTVLHTAVLAAMWLMVRHRVLFRVIPR
jgi:hypothetical protein